MKKIVFVLLVLLLLVGCAPQPEAVAFATPEEQAAIATSSAAQIPEALIQFFNGVVIALFTAGFVWVFEKFGLDLRQYAIPLATTAATWVVTELQGYINTIPEINDVYLNLLFRILLALIPAFGLLRIFSKQPATLLEVNVPPRVR
jgi:hypothetical protein